jgi:outer membrane lipoprotein carrier protein
MLIVEGLASPRRFTRASALLSAALIAAGAARLAAQSDADAPVDRAAATWAKIKTVRGTFEQTVTNSLIGTSATTHGSYAEERPNRLSIRFAAPATDAIVADGRFVWIYLPSSAPGQVLKRPATERGEVPIDLTGRFLDAPRAKYTIRPAGTRSVDGHASHAFTLVPKAGVEAPFTTATIWIDDDDSLIREFEETEPSGVVRRVHLTAVEPNGAVDRSAFAFTSPAGVRIVDQTKP